MPARDLGAESLDFEADPELGAEEMLVLRPALVFSDLEVGWFSPWIPSLEVNSPPSFKDSAARDSLGIVPAPSCLTGAF